MQSFSLSLHGSFDAASKVSALVSVSVSTVGRLAVCMYMAVLVVVARLHTLPADVGCLL